MAVDHARVGSPQSGGPDSIRATRKTRRRARLAKSFYDSALEEAERAELGDAREVEGIDQEIAYLRLKLRGLISERPPDLQLMFRGIDLLAKAVAARYKLSADDREDLAASLANAVKSLDVLWPAVDGDE
jgi:hypothetical protein